MPSEERTAGSDTLKVMEPLGDRAENHRRKACQWSHEFVLNSVAGGRTARGDPDLAVDGSQIPVDGATTEDELFGDLGVAQSLSHQPQHLDLPFRQSVGIDG